MASASLTCSGRTGAMGASVSITEKSTSGTTRTLHVTLVVTIKDGYTGSRSFKYSANVAGEDSSGDGSISGSYTIFNKDISVSVGYGNTTANASCTYSASLYSQAAGGWVSISGGFSSITGLTLDQGSTSIASALNTEFGSPCEITWTPSSSTIYNKLVFSMGQWTHTTDPIYPGTNKSYTYKSYTIPYEAASEIPNATSGTMNVTLYSYSDSDCIKQVGSGSPIQFTVSLSNTAKPSINSYAAIMDNSGNSTIRTWGIALTGYTKVRLTASASGIYGSSITRFNISGGYESIINNYELDYTGRVIQTSGDKVFTITCTDSRGRTSEPVITDAITFQTYVAPTISQVTSAKESSGFASVSTIFSYDNVGGRNSITATLSYRPVGSQTWYQYSSIQSNVKLTTTISPTDEQSYYFKVTIQDSIGNKVEKESFLSTIKVLLDFKKDGDGLGIGKICENPGMEVFMDATFFSGVNIGNQTLQQYIQSIMKILPTGMYGTGDPPATASVGQVYYKRVDS